MLFRPYRIKLGRIPTIKQFRDRSCFCENGFPVNLVGESLDMDGPPTLTDELYSKGGTYSIMISFRPQLQIPARIRHTEAIIHKMHSHNFLNNATVFGKLQIIRSF